MYNRKSTANQHQGTEVFNLKKLKNSQYLQLYTFCTEINDPVGLR